MFTSILNDPAYPRKNAKSYESREILTVSTKRDMFRHLFLLLRIILLPQHMWYSKLTMEMPEKLGLPRLRRMSAGYFDDSTPPAWDALLLYDSALGIKIGIVAESTSRVRETLRDHVPTVLADLVIQYCRRVDFHTILDLTHPSNMDVQELLISYGCNMTS